MEAYGEIATVKDKATEPENYQCLSIRIAKEQRKMTQNF